MGSFPGWAKWPIIAAGVLLSPVLAFLLALSVAVLVAVIKEAGLAASLAALCYVAYALIALVRGAQTKAAPAEDIVIELDVASS